MKSVINISFLTNKYINDEQPWALKDKNIEKMNNILHISLEQIAKISILLNPIIPISSSKVLDALNIETKYRNLSFLNPLCFLMNIIHLQNEVQHFYLGPVAISHYAFVNHLLNNKCYTTLYHRDHCFWYDVLKQVANHNVRFQIHMKCIRFYF